MRRLSFASRAPSNIALIKYMGKTESALNLPENASLSMTLDALSTWVEATPSVGSEVRWIPELPRVPEIERVGAGAAFAAPKLEGKGVERLARHVERARTQAREVFARFGLEFDADAASRGLELRSANSFPAASGIASSASAFAAITTVAAHSCARDPDAFLRALDDVDFRRALARISRQGSGSSCRSFEGPFVYWEGEEARALETGMPALAHFVLLISSEEKKTSSSAAHLQIKSSPLWPARLQHLGERTARMTAALAAGRVSDVARLAWTEAWEMHSLFHTAEPPFSYWQPGTVAALQWLAPFFESNSTIEPPIATLDAGPNVHLIVRASDRELWRARISERFPELKVLEDQPGAGAIARVRSLA